MMGHALKLKYFVISGFFLTLYLLGVLGFSFLQGTSWDNALVFWVDIVCFPLWVKILSGCTVITGTALIYFLPGVFIVKAFSDGNEASIELWMKGFLVNYGFYYLASTLYKAVFHLEFSRIQMVELMACSILGMGVMFCLTKTKNSLQQEKLSAGSVSDIKFTVYYLLFISIAFLIVYNKILFYQFTGDGAEQYWLAHSVKSELLPTSYRSQFTLIPQFAFAPSVYLNMFALILFGNSEFSIRIVVLVAYISIGFILRKIIEEMRKDRKLSMIEFIPMFLYLFIFLLVLAYRANYRPSTDIAKGDEALELAFFFSGFYLLSQEKRNKDGLAAVFFVLAAMIRYNGLFMITAFIAVFSILFKRFKCLMYYLSGLILLVVLMAVLQIPLAFSCKTMLDEVLNDIIRSRVSAAHGLDLVFVSDYLKRYFILTAGLSLFYIFTFRNKYVTLMGITSVLYFIFPSGTNFLPVHFFAPIIMFPLLSYYVLKL